MICNFYDFPEKCLFASRRENWYNVVAGRRVTSNTMSAEVCGIRNKCLVTHPKM